MRPPACPANGTNLLPDMYGGPGRQVGAGLDAKILAVPAHGPRSADVQDLGDLPYYLLAEIGHFLARPLTCCSRRALSEESFFVFFPTG